jgi:hypothetical protein
MSTLDGFWNYAGRFLRRFVADSLYWVRDNVLVALFMATAPPVLVYLRDRKHPIDWDIVRTTLWLYGVSLLIYVGTHLLRTPWKLDQERETELAEAGTESAQLRNEIEKLRREAEAKRPVLDLEVFDVLFVESDYPREVFVEVGISNQRPDSICTVTRYKLKVFIGGHAFSSEEIKHDLADFWLVTEPTRMEHPGAAAADQASYESIADVAAGISHLEPIRFGAPRRGWIHFCISDAPPMVQGFCPAQTVELEVHDPFGSAARFHACVNLSRIRRIETQNIDPVIHWA